MKIFNSFIKSIDIRKFQLNDRLSDKSYFLINRVD